MTDYLLRLGYLPEEQNLKRKNDDALAYKNQVMPGSTDINLRTGPPKNEHPQQLPAVLSSDV